MPQTDKPRRGRPRPQESVERDKAILKLLRDDRAWTRNQIADKLGIRPQLVYLSLDRLRNAGEIEQIENDSRFVWRKAAAG